MKKFILSISITLLFLVYLLYQRQSTPSVTVSPSTTSTLAPSSQNNSPVVTQASNSTATAGSGNPPASTATTPAAGIYKDGQYVGTRADAYYGYVQVTATVQGGKLTNVQFQEYPSDRQQSQRINTQAMPRLISEAVTAQSANVNTVSGATDTSQAFRQSLTAALSQARA